MVKNGNIIMNPPIPHGFKPMLAYNKDYALADLRYPMFMSVKLDGIRFLTNGIHLLSRELIHIPNRYLQVYVPMALEHGLEGELIHPSGNFHLTQSIVMSQKHPCEEEIQWKIFDRWNAGTLTYEARYLTLPIANRVHQTQVKSPEDVLVEEQRHEDVEGFILRDKLGRYKHGRCTLREQNVFKYVHWERSEGVCVSVYDNTMHDDRIGGIVVRHAVFGDINVGSGFSHAMSREWKAKPESIIAKTITFKYKKFGTKNAPRTAIFVGAI